MWHIRTYNSAEYFLFSSLLFTLTLSLLSLSLPQVDTAKSGNSAIRALSYYLVIFPSIDVTSAFPLVVHTVSNNIYTALFCRDTSKKSKTPKLDFALQLVIKLVSAIVPITAALFVSNLVYVLKYAGIMGLFISFFFPTALQLSSTWKCSSIFSSSGAAGGKVNMPSLGYKTRTYDMQSSSIVCDGAKVSGQLAAKLRRLFTSYHTPYSNRVFSHPLVVAAIGVVGVLLFLLAIGSLALHPTQIHCYSDI